MPFVCMVFPLIITSKPDLLFGQVIAKQEIEDDE